MVDINIFSGKTSSLPKGLSFGLLISWIITLTATGTLAAMINADTLSIDDAGYAIAATIYVSSLVGAKVSYGKIRSQRLMISLLSGVLYFSSLLLLTAVLFGGQFAGVGATALLISGGSVCAAILVQHRKGRRK